MKLALLQCNLISGQLKYNAECILAQVRQAHTLGAELCISSELALCGAPPNDLLSRFDFIESCNDVARNMAQVIQQESLPPLLLGLPMLNPAPQGKALHNCAVLLKEGRLNVISRKVLLAHDNIKNDSSYFEAGMACGTLQLNGWRFGVTIGEDIWNDRGFWPERRPFARDPVEDLMYVGVDALLNLSANPYSMTDGGQYKKILFWSAARYRVPILAANFVGGMDNIVYHGGSLAVKADGSLNSEAAWFSEDLLLVDLAATEKRKPKEPSLLMEQVWGALVLGVRDFVYKSGFKKVLLGLSGGLDSALVATIAAKALGGKNVLGVLLPSPYSSKGSIDDSLLLAKNIGIETVTIPIADAMLSFEQILNPVFNNMAPDTTEENIQARIRGLILMAISNKHGRMLLNTSNKTEMAVGYSTLYGDMNGALAVLGDLYKTDAYRLARYINQIAEKDVIPITIIEKAPSAELRPEQKDSDSLPDYIELDALLRAYHEEEKNMQELLDEGFSPELVERILKLYFNAEFKRLQSAPVLCLSQRAFGGYGKRLPTAVRKL